MFAALDSEQFQKCFVGWAASQTGIPADVIAIDGKTSRRSGKKGVNPIHTVSAFAARQRLVLGQVKVAEKSNEIVAIPKLLDMLAIEGDVELFAKEQKARKFKDTTVSQDETVDGDHGRIETRRTTVFHDVGWLWEHDWSGLKAVVMVESEREIGAKVERETRFYITSSTEKAGGLGLAVRRHWAVESMHWLMDCVFRDDECRVRTEHAPANFATVKHMALNLLRHHPAKKSMTSKRLAAGWDDDFLVSVIR